MLTNDDKICDVHRQLNDYRRYPTVLCKGNIFIEANTPIAQHPKNESILLLGITRELRYESS